MLNYLEKGWVPPKRKLSTHVHNKPFSCNSLSHTNIEASDWLTIPSNPIYSLFMPT